MHTSGSIYSNAGIVTSYINTALLILIDYLFCFQQTLSNSIMHSVDSHLRKKTGSLFFLGLEADMDDRHFRNGFLFAYIFFPLSP